MLLDSLLSGLAAKVRFYCHPDISGFTATIRLMNKFIAAKEYPRRWWAYNFAVALLRNGVPFPCLTRSMRKLLISHGGKTQMESLRLSKSEPLNWTTGCYGTADTVAAHISCGFWIFVLGQWQRKPFAFKMDPLQVLLIFFNSLSVILVFDRLKSICMTDVFVALCSLFFPSNMMQRSLYIHLCR